MADKFLGSYVSIDCGDTFGFYQGMVAKIDTVSQALTLKDAWRNGTACSDEVTILAHQIANLCIIPSPKEDAKTKIVQQTAAAGLRTISPKVGKSPRKTPGSNVPPPAPETPTKDHHKKNRPMTKDEVCFATDDVNMDKDFDFETNLALFDKKAVMGEIKSGKQQVPPRDQGGKGVVSKFRHDENVLESAPPLYRQINLPCATAKEFLTGTTSTAFA